MRTLQRSRRTAPQLALCPLLEQRRGHRILACRLPCRFTVPMITAPVAGGWIVLQLARIMCAADCGAHNQQVACRLSVTSDFAESCLRYERVESKLAPCLFTSFPLVEPAWFNVSSRPWCPRPWPRGAFCTAPVQKFWAHFSLTLNWGFDTVGLSGHHTKSNQSLN